MIRFVKGFVIFSTNSISSADELSSNESTMALDKIYLTQIVMLYFIA